MADDLENLAKRLQEFIETARREASGRGGVQTQVGVPLPTNILQELYKKYLGELTADEREALDGMIEMRRGLPTRPGAINPP
jgi:hypothetical protein